MNRLYFKKLLFMSVVLSVGVVQSDKASDSQTELFELIASDAGKGRFEFHATGFQFSPTYQTEYEEQIEKVAGNLPSTQGSFRFPITRTVNQDIYEIARNLPTTQASARGKDTLRIAKRHPKTRHSPKYFLSSKDAQSSRRKEKNEEARMLQKNKRLSKSREEQNTVTFEGKKYPLPDDVLTNNFDGTCTLKLEGIKEEIDLLSDDIGSKTDIIDIRGRLFFLSKWAVSVVKRNLEGVDLTNKSQEEIITMVNAALQSPK